MPAQLPPYVGMFIPEPPAALRNTPLEHLANRTIPLMQPPRNGIDKQPSGDGDASPAAPPIGNKTTQAKMKRLRSKSELNPIMHPKRPRPSSLLTFHNTLYKARMMQFVHSHGCSLSHHLQNGTISGLDDVLALLLSNTRGCFCDAVQAATRALAVAPG